MSAHAEAPNYWPGFVDALVTVLLNLLFLVGVFTIGLVSLNLEVMIVQKKLAEEEARALLALKNGMLPLPQGGVVRLTLAPQPKPQPAPQPMPLPAAPLVAAGQARIQELKIQAPPGNAEQLNLSANKASRADGAADLSKIADMKAYLEQLTGGQLVERLAFEPQQFVWPTDRSIPVLDISTAQRGWIFVILTDKNNPRLVREAFNRLGSIRAESLRLGTAPDKVQIQIGAMPPDMGPALSFNDTVWILRRSLTK